MAQFFLLIVVFSSFIAHGMEQDQQVTFLTGDNQRVTMPKQLACLSIHINNMLSECDDAPDRAISLPKVSEPVLKKIKLDLERVAQSYHGVATLDQVTAMDHKERTKHGIAAAKALAVMQYDSQGFQELSNNWNGVDFLQIPELCARYGEQIADMLRSEPSLRLLLNSSADHVRNIKPHMADAILPHIPKIFMCGHEIKHDNWVSAVAMSADGLRVVRGSDDNTAQIIGCDNGTWVTLHEIKHDNCVYAAAISADGLRVVTGSLDKTARITGCDNGTWVTLHEIKHDNCVYAAAISANGSRVVMRSLDNTVRITGFDNGRWGPLYEIKHDDWVGAVAISADGSRVVTGSFDNTAQITGYDNGRWGLLHKIKHDNWVRAVAISADGSKVVTGSSDKTARIIGCDNGRWSLLHEIKHDNWVRAVAISADGSRVVTGSFDNTARIIGCDNGRWSLLHEITHNNWVYAVAISADGTKLVSVSHDGTALIAEQAPAHTLPQALLVHLLNSGKNNSEPMPQSDWIRRVMGTYNDADRKAVQRIFGITNESNA